jgi:hypothetical protein
MPLASDAPPKILGVNAVVAVECAHMNPMRCVIAYMNGIEATECVPLLNYFRHSERFVSTI